ncbi:hypothetical protein FACS189459_1670 [Bacilli bacterium]|nr:hypothetical protein FACS189459_1670 [Bacilli bacterium]
MDTSTAIKRIKEHLTDDKVTHSINVADICKKLARFHDIGAEKAWIAGIYHDIAKNFDTTMILDLTLNDDTDRFPNIKTMHGVASANFIKKTYKIKDPLILEAISNHVIPAEDISILGKILYIADKLEPEKLYFDDADDLLLQAQEEIDEVYEKVLNATKKYNAQKNVDQSDLD